MELGTLKHNMNPEVTKISTLFDHLQTKYFMHQIKKIDKGDTKYIRNIKGNIIKISNHSKKNAN